MRLEVLREFEVIAHNLSFSAAARELNITQPNLSRHIGALEKELGFNLFDRSQGVRITPEGAVYLDVVSKIINEHDAVVEKCREIRKGALSRIRVVKPPTYNEGFDSLYSLLSKYKEENPDCLISFETAKNEYSIDKVMEESCDLAISSTSVGDIPDLFKTARRYGVLLEPIASAQLLLWVHESNPLAGRAAITLDELKNIKMSFAANRAFDYLQYAYRALIPNSSGIQADNSHAYVAANIEEFCMYLRKKDVCIMTESMVSHPVIAAQLDRVAIPIDDPTARLVFFMVHQSKPANPEVKAIVDYVVQTIPENESAELQRLIDRAS